MKWYKVNFIQIEVTSHCNLRCLYCYNGNYINETTKAEGLSFPQIKKIILDGIAHGCSRIILTGGEPLLYSKFFDLLEFCALVKMEVIINSNGTLFNNENVSSLLRFRQIIKEIKVSFDGDGHDQIRGPGVKDVVIKGLNRLNQFGFPWTINTIVTKQNVLTLNSIFDFLKSMRPFAWRIDLPFRFGNFLKNEAAIKIDNLEVAFVQFHFILNRYLSIKPDFELWMFSIYRPGLESLEIAPQELHHHPCTYNKRNLAFRWNGDITPCTRLFHTLGNAKKQTLDIVSKNELFRNFWKIKIGDLQECHICKYFLICGGGCRAFAKYENGCILKPDPLACKIMPLFEQYILPLLGTITKSSFQRLTHESSRLISERSGVRFPNDKCGIYETLFTPRGWV